MYPDIDEIRIMPSDELRALSDYLGFYSRKNKSIFGIISRWLPNKFHDSIFPDATSIFTILPVYGIPPAFASENKELAKIPQTLSDASVARGIRFISDHHLDPQKVLILVPYARSSSSIPCGELDGVVDFYHKHGFKVYTTTIGQEKPVDKTEPLSISADVLFSLISQGAVVIGVQCGLIDVCEWMHLTDRIIKDYLLIRDPDYLFFGNRKGDISRRIEKKEYGYTIAVSSEEDRKSLGNDIIELSRKFLD